MAASERDAPEAGVLARQTSDASERDTAGAVGGAAAGDSGGSGEVTVAAAVIDLICRGVEVAEEAAELQVLKGLLTTVSGPPTHPLKSESVGLCASGQTQSDASGTMLCHQLRRPTRALPRQKRTCETHL